MKAITKSAPQPGLQLTDLPIPKILPHEVLIKIRKTSICGTDLHIYKWDAWAQKTVPTPLVIGHEFMGEIVEIGSAVKGIRKGDRVSGEGHLTCGLCPPCKQGHRHLCMNTVGVGVKTQGCFAEYLALPAENVFRLPQSVSDDIASFFDPFGNAVHTALSFPLTTQDVLITGAGPIGIMAAAIARKAGARTVVITDHNEYRLQLARQMGATHTVNIKEQSVKEIMKIAGIDFGFTVGLEMSGHPQALNTLLETAQPGACLALLGILPPQCAIDWDLVIFKMLIIKGIYGREIFKTWHQMVHLLESGLDLNPLITHQFDATDYEKGFAAMQSGNCGKVILNW
jgi:threonine 3-dehydrogenase